MLIQIFQTAFNRPPTLPLVMNSILGLLTLHLKYVPVQFEIEKARLVLCFYGINQSKSILKSAVMRPQFQNRSLDNATPLSFLCENLFLFSFVKCIIYHNDTVISCLKCTLTVMFLTKCQYIFFLQTRNCTRNFSRGIRRTFIIGIVNK